MTVPVNKRPRGHVKLEAGLLADKLLRHTFTIAKNKKIFLEEYYDVFTHNIIDCVLDIHMYVMRANDINVKKVADKNARLDSQYQAILRCIDLKYLIYQAKALFHLKSKKVKYWMKLLEETKQKIRSWRLSDMRRYIEIC
jgi:chaperone required for assembly of F1-ATPase